MKNTTITNTSGQVIVGNVVNSTVKNVVSGHEPHDIDKLITLVERTAGADRAELLTLLRDVRAHLIDGTIDRAQATSAFDTFLGRAAQYARSAKDLWELAGSIRAVLG